MLYINAPIYSLSPSCMLQCQELCKKFRETFFKEKILKIDQANISPDLSTLLILLETILLYPGLTDYYIIYNDLISSIY